MQNLQGSTKNISLIYFGSGPLAAESLHFLHQNFTVELVITKPRPAHHAGSVPVLEYCQVNKLPHKTPATKTELSELFAKLPIKSSMGVVIDYGIIIAKDVIDTFPLGIINSHFSLLPTLRGADPITFAILNGLGKTGVSLMQINEKMDEGPILAYGELQLDKTTDASSLTQDLTALSNALLLQMLPIYASGAAVLQPQESFADFDKKLSYSSKLSKADGIIDWQKPAEQIEREIRAYIEWPKSRATLGNVDVIITKAHAVPSTMPEDPGHIEILQDSGTIMVNTSDGYLCIDMLKPAGKKEMSTAEFIRGYAAKIQL